MENYKHMIDKMLGSDEELKAKRRQWGAGVGGEMVQVDSDPSTTDAGSTVPANMGGNIE